jgi:hypothetical protein
VKSGSQRAKRRRRNRTSEARKLLLAGSGSPIFDEAEATAEFIASARLKTHRRSTYVVDRCR